ncbi:hypothetical protein PHMEG_0003738 [Phytophthora megakarya]|uniref:Uncharacterized protein n=1 Tax=Phytophthora megakarya TaxID=4795 RepID=A0A225WXA8_9STRA|nr:hypothetical protein PHMEG_0003738 [Phytophthora megakarya]
MAAVRVLFDRIIKMYPVTKEHLSPDARIVHSPSFERGVVKVATNRVESLSEDETTALKPFELQMESPLLLVAVVHVALVNSPVRRTLPRPC